MTPINPTSTAYQPVRHEKTKWLPLLGIAGLLLGAGMEAYLSLSTTPSLQNRVNVLAGTPFWNMSSPRYTAFTKLQYQVDRLTWKEPLTVTPPLPERSYPIKKEQAENWISAHFGEEEQHAARAFVDATRHVPHKEFEQALSHSIAQFNEHLEQEENKEYILITNKHKSNRWVAELGLKYFKFLPSQVMDMDSINHRLSEEFVKFTRENPQHKTFVYMDDATYGCSQTKRAVAELSSLDIYHECPQGLYFNNGDRCEVDRIRKQEKQYRIKVIIPFMREPGCILPSSNVNASHPHPPLTDKHIQVFTTEKIDTIKNLLSNKSYSVLKSLYPNALDDNHLSIYFDHKLADCASVPNQIYTGEYPPASWSSIPGNGYSQKKKEEGTLWNKLSSWIAGPSDTCFIDPIHPPYRPKSGS